MGEYELLETHVSNQVSSTLDRLRQEDVACCGNSYNMRVFAERFERDWVVDLPVRFARVVKGYQLRRLEWLLSNRVRVVVLSRDNVIHTTRKTDVETYVLEPRYNIDQIEHKTRAVCIPGTYRVFKGLECQSTAVERCPCPRMRSLGFPVAKYQHFALIKSRTRTLCGHQTMQCIVQMHARCE